MKRLRLNDSSVVDRIGEQATSRLRGHQHLAAIGPNQSTVVNQRIECTLGDGDIQQLVASNIQRDSIACGQSHRAQLGSDNTLVADVGAQQGHIATIGCVDRSLVAHRTIAGTRKLIIARHETGVADGQSRRHQPPHIDGCSLTEQDAVRVDQKHFAVGRETAQNTGGVRAHHTVQRDRATARLNKLHRFARLDAKVLPVDGHVRRGLGNGHLAGSAANGGRAG